MKKAIVTGANRGIGRAIAECLAESGYDVVAHCRLPEDAAATAEALRRFGSSGGSLAFDVSDRAAASAALGAWMRANGAPWAVVLNAGCAADAPFPAMDDADWDRVVETALGGFRNVLKPLALGMALSREGGRIVAVTSASAFRGRAGQANYAAAKAGVEAAAMSLAAELAPRGVTVNCVAPGWIATRMTEGMAREVLPSIPAGRFGRPEEVAALVRFLVSPEAAYITRQTVRIDGGLQ